MIGYPIHQNDIIEKINFEVPGWLTKVEERTAKFRNMQKYQENSSCWGEVKSVFMDIQNSKCAYCERRLEGPPYGRIEHDLEHYRPKKSVKRWPTNKISQERGLKFNFSTGEAWSEGYYLLAYNINNYATACKTCNSILKSNYFPIAKERGPQSDNPVQLLSEKPYIPYPLGEFDTSPQQLIGFEGLIPIPIGINDHDKKRGIITIKFFELDTREELLRGRAEQVRLFIFAKEIINSSNNQSMIRRSQNAIDALKSPVSPHTNCTNSFIALYNQNRNRADLIADLIMNYLETE